MPVCPTLNNTKDILTDDSHICANLIVFSVRNPGNVIDFHRDEELSLQLLKNKYENDKKTLVGKYKDLLSKAINRMLPDAGIIVDVDYEWIDESIGTYSISIKVKYPDGSYVVKSNAIALTDNKFSLSFDQ